MKKSAMRYLNCMNGVETTTINTEGTGVITIHLIPARVGKRELDSLVILNGYKMATLRPSWTILLSVFIREVNKYSGKEMSEEEWIEVESKICKKMKKIFPYHSKEKFIFDLNELIESLSQIARENAYELDDSIAISDYVDKMAGPIRMDLMVSSIKMNEKWNCNQKCKYCNFVEKTHDEVSEMSTYEWKKVIEKLWKEAYVSQITFTGGGEPTMREDLVEIIKTARRFITKLETNGIKLENKDYCRKLKNAFLDSVKITLYSSNSDIHNKLVGIPNGFEKTVKGIKNALNEKMNVTVNTPIVFENKEGYRSTLEFLRQLGVVYVECSSVTDDIKYAEWLRILKEAAKFCEENGMKLTFSLPGKVPDSILKKLDLEIPHRGECLFNMAIAPNGNVIPCTTLNDINSSLGNIFGAKWFDGIWMNPKAQTIRKEIIKNI